MSVAAPLENLNCILTWSEISVFVDHSKWAALMHSCDRHRQNVQWALCGEVRTFAMNFEALADCCLALVESDVGQSRDWRIAKVTGGMNNLVFRATRSVHSSNHGNELRRPHDDLAIKFTIRDARDRAGREFATLTLFEQLGLPVAPKAIYLNRFEAEPNRSPVVIQTWLAGQTISAETLTRDDWQRLINHLHIIHSATPALAQQKQITLPQVVLTMRSAREGLDAVRWQTQQLLVDEQPPALRDLMSQLERIDWPSWPEPEVCLCRGDNNHRNFIKPILTRENWRSVDWEYSGWGDPAFEIADLMTMPNYLGQSEAHWVWVLAQYLKAVPQVEQPAFVLRVQTYRRLMTVWWVARFARMIHEMPRQKDKRLVPFDPNAFDEYRERLGIYVRRAWGILQENVTDLCDL